MTESIPSNEGIQQPPSQSYQRSHSPGALAPIILSVSDLRRKAQTISAAFTRLRRQGY